MIITYEKDNTTGQEYYLASQRLATGRLLLAEGVNRRHAVANMLEMMGLQPLDVWRGVVRICGTAAQPNHDLLNKEQAL